MGSRLPPLPALLVLEDATELRAVRLPQLPAPDEVNEERGEGAIAELGGELLELVADQVAPLDARRERVGEGGPVPRDAVLSLETLEELLDGGVFGGAAARIERVGQLADGEG